MDEEEVFTRVVLLVENISCTKLNGLKLMHNGCRELLRSVLEELDLFEYLPVGLVDNLVSQGNRQLCQELLRCLKLLLDLHVLEMPLDSIEESDGQLVLAVEMLKDLDLVLELLVVLIERGDHRCHITDCVRVEAYSEDHPTYTHDLFSICPHSDIAKAYGCERLEGPVK